MERLGRFRSARLRPGAPWPAWRSRRRGPPARPGWPDYAAVNATSKQLDELERLTRKMGESTDHIALVAALRACRVEEAVEVSRRHVGILHPTMFTGLAQG